MLTGYEQIYQNLLPQLMVCDLAEAAERLGLTCAPGGVIELSFLGRQYDISKHGVVPADGSPVSALTGCVLLYYALSKGSGEPKRAFSPLFRLSGLHDGQNMQNLGLTNKQLTKTFGADYEAFAKAAAKVGGSPADEDGKGCHSWIFALFPKILAKIDFYQADEEFPADVQVFLDETALRFMDFECAAFLSGCLVQGMIDGMDDVGRLEGLSFCGFIQEMG